MKRCPQCNRTYADDMDFCLDDGTRLTFYSSIVSADVPTQVFAPFAAKAASPRETGNLIYVVIGVMATLIVALVAVLLYMSSGSKDNAASQNQAAQTSPKPETKSTSPQSINIASANAPSNPPITEDAARMLVEKWRKAQIDKDFLGYKSCYAQTPEFIGRKETKSGRSRQYNISGWLADRQKMFAKIIEVRADNQRYSADGDTEVVIFTQKWMSQRYCDIGEKTLRIKMFADGPRIVFENIVDPLPCG